MSLQQIKHINSVGRFRACTPFGDVTFKKFNLIFGENGRGKSTLCSILRSLQNNDPAIILGRKTLGEDKEQNIVLVFTNGTALFKNGTWNNVTTKLRIFDAQYIAENVYFGDSIGTDQRRNLCRVMLGHDGVAFAKAYDEADVEITITNNEIKGARKQLSIHVTADLLDQFLKLNKDPEIDSKIEAKEREVEGLKEINNLRTRAGLQTLDIPQPPSKLEDILGHTLGDVSRDAEAVVKRHLTIHKMESEEDRLSTGLLNIRNNECPFCGQSTNGIDLISAYKAYFNEAYISFKQKLKQYTQLPNHHYSDDKIEILRSKIEMNTSSADVWKRYLPLTAPDLKIDVTTVIKAFRDEAIKLLNIKNANPFEEVKLSIQYQEALQKLLALTTAMQAYNATLTTANTTIEEFKKLARSEHLQSAQNELKWLQLTKKRHEQSIARLCDQFGELITRKEALDKTKANARDKLDTYSASVVANYRKSLNKYLETFNAGFHLDQIKVEYSGRVPNSTFCIVINNTQVETGRNDTPLNEPSFRNTLSSGDKSTLALAFFLAQIDSDPENKECVAVFDDPFNSQDQFRRTCTMGEIRRCGRNVAQVIVMSHDARFLRDLWEQQLPTNERKALRILPFGHKNTTISEWPIDVHTESDDDNNRRALLNYYLEGKGEPRDVIQKLRPVIETHIQRTAPQISSVKGLGNMLEKIRADGAPSILLDVYDAIDDLNNYTRKYMHGEGKNPNTEPVDALELNGFVRKVLEIAGNMIN
jgi:wobble nucleotide-excising tRNase